MNGAAQRFALVILVEKHQVGGLVIRIDELFEGTRNGAGRHKGKHQSAHITRLIGYHRPTGIIVMQNLVNLLDQVGHALAATHGGVVQHVYLKVLQSTQNLRALHAAWLVGVRHNIHFLGAGKVGVDVLGRYVVVVIRIENRGAGFRLPDLNLGAEEASSDIHSQGEEQYRGRTSACW